MQMIQNEMFLDTSLTRRAVSHAKSLGYTPSSVKAPKNSYYNSICVPTTQTSLTLTGTTFSTSVNDISYTHDSDHTATSDNGVFTFSDMQLRSRISFQYVVNTSDLEQQFVIPSSNADTSTLLVRVQTLQRIPLQQPTH